MNFREAQVEDIDAMHIVRVAVKENPLPDPAMITAAEYEDFMTSRGRGWVCETDGQILGFAIVDLTDRNVWALFVQPGHEKKGIGKHLQRLMIDWYFSKTGEPIWLGTAPNSRAEHFYRASGWKQTGVRPNGEVRFEMDTHTWKKVSTTA